MKCRFCNEMLGGFQPGDEVLSKRVPPTTPAKPSRARRGLLASAALFVVGAIVVYSVLPRGAQDTINELASRSGPAGRAIPWIDRADTTTRTMLAGPSGLTAAKIIQAITHPTGKNPSLRTFDVRRMGDRISVRLSTSWQGGFVGTDYTTVVVWEFSEGGHISAKVIADDTMIGPGNARQLDDYFRLEFFPVLRSNTGD